MSGRSGRPFGYFRDHHGRGPNADAYDRLRTHETDRRGWYPVPGTYLRAIREGDARTAAGESIRLRHTDTRTYDAAAWQQEKRRALHARISAKGGIAYSRFNSPHYRGIDPAFHRDARALRDLRQRIIIRSFETRAVRERFGHLLCETELY